MNDAQPSLPCPCPRSRHRRGVAALVGALVVSAPLASAQAAPAHRPAVEAAAPIDLHEVVTIQHRRVLDGIEVLLGRALLRSSLLRAAVHDRVSIDWSFDGLVTTDDEADEDVALAEPAPASAGRRQKIDVATDTNDPLAGLF
ncbi:MAG: hypothetical protein H6712_31910 [Myxococcales bacterium]|nr:hypothetical protein [Myxococcales bacterium]MCB9718499.1 hypothetical protein [Myxococcales bacterium]